MAQLLDHLGNPIVTGLLKSQVATATPSGVRTARSQYTLTGLDPARLARILRNAEAGDATAFLELAEQMEEKYLHYAAQLATRKRAVKGLDWDVDPASERLQDRKIAAFVKGLVPVLKRATFDMMDAVGKGYAVGELIWDTTGTEWTIRAIEWRDPRWFQFDKIDGRTLRMRSDINPDGDPLPPGKFFVVRIAAKSGLPIRAGLARAACWAWMCVNFSTRDWLTFGEEFGKPLRLGRYEAGATPADLAILFEAVSSLGTDAAAILPKSMEIEFPEVQGARGDAGLWSGLIDHFDRKISMLVLGQTLTADTGKGGGGSYALGNVHNDVRLDILASDAEAFAEAASEQLVPLLVNLNFAGVTAYPTLSLPVPHPEDLTALAAIVEKAVGMGQPVSATWFSNKFSIPLPQAGEVLLGKTTAQAEPTPAPAAQRASHARAQADAIDPLIDTALEDWQPMMTPLVAPLQAAMDEAAAAGETAEQFLARLPALLAQMDVTPMAERLGQLATTTRLAGVAGIEAEDGDA